MIRDIPFKLLLLPLLIPLVSAIPLLIGYASTQAPEQLFMGFDFIDDFHYYGNYIQSYAENPFDLLIDNRATTELQDGRFFFPLFWVTGIASNLIGLPLAFALIRYILAVIMLIALWHVLGHIFTDAFWRKTAYAFALLGAGFGWIFWVLGKFIPVFSRLYSTDLTYSLGYTLFGTLSFPLSIAGQALFLIALLLFLRYMEKPTLRNLILFAFVILLQFFTHLISSIAFVPIFIVGMALYFYENPFRETWNKLKPIILAFIGVAIAVGLYLFWAMQDMVFQQIFITYGSWIRSESVFWWILGYGLILVFGLLGLRHLKIEKPMMRSIFWAWLITIIFLSLNPWKGMRFQFALFIPLIILATTGLQVFHSHLSHWFPKNFFANRRHLVLGLLLFMLPGIFLTIYTHARDVTNPQFQYSGSYLSQDEVDALTSLQTKPSAVVLSSYKLGNNLIWMTHHYAYLGHWNQTLDREAKEINVQKLFENQLSLEEKKLFLVSNRIRYAIITKTETSNEIIPPELGKKIYSNSSLEIYEVDCSCESGLKEII